MAEAQGQAGARVATRDPDEIRADIERTREALGETVAAVASKTDVKRRAREKTAAAKKRATSRDVLIPLAITGVAAGAAVLVLGVRRRRRARDSGPRRWLEELRDTRWLDGLPDPRRRLQELRER